jgi:threonine/homoserine/homoserine lactone efflux protein
LSFQIPDFPAYLWVTAALVLTPGATTTVVIRQAITGGRRAGIATAAGAAVANSTHAAAAGLGLAVLILRAPGLVTAIRVAGGAYLVWLGLQSLRRAWRPGPSLADRVGARAAPRVPGFRDGVVVNLLNPAIATFYLVVVPSFLTPTSSWRAFAALAAVHVGLAFACHVAWSLLFDLVRRATRSAAVLRGLDAIAGAALVALAWRVW